MSLLKEILGVDNPSYVDVSPMGMFLILMCVTLVTVGMLNILIAQVLFLFVVWSFVCVCERERERAMYSHVRHLGDRGHVEHPHRAGTSFVCCVV